MRILILTLILLAHPIHASNEAENLILRGLDLVYDLQFQEADLRFDSLIALYPNHPQGYFFKGGSYFYQIISGYKSDMPEEKFIEWNERALEIADSFEKETNNILEADFYRGAIYGNLGRYYAVNSEWTKAFYYTRKSKSMHEDVIDRDHTFFDAYLSPGVYYYYAAQLPRAVDVLASILGLSGDREKGITMLEKAYHRGRLGQLEAQFMLASVYVEEGRYEDAESIYAEMCRRFPHNPYLQNQLGLARYLLDRFDESELLFSNTMKTAASYPRAQMFAAYHLGRIQKLRKRFSEAQMYLETAVVKASGETLFKSIDGWVPAAALYHAGESAELNGHRDKAVAFFKRSRDEKYSTRGITQAAKNRLRYAISDFETLVIRARHDVILGGGPDSMVVLLSAALADLSLRKYVAQIRYYLGQSALQTNDYATATNYFRQALDSPDNDLTWLVPHAHYYQAYAEERLGHKDTAVTELRKALKQEGYQEETRMRYLCKTLLRQLGE